MFRRQGSERTLSTSVAIDLTSAAAVPPVDETCTAAWASALAVAVCQAQLFPQVTLGVPVQHQGKQCSLTEEQAVD